MSTSSTTADRRRLGIVVALAAGASIAAHAAFALWPDLFVAWDRKVSDRFFTLRSGLACAARPCVDEVVHVDLTYSALRRMPSRHAARADHGRVIRNLAEAGARTQVFDFAFPAPGDPDGDRALADAAAAAGAVYFGLVFHVEPPSRDELDDDRADDALLERAAWDVQVDGDPNQIPEGFAPLSAYADLAAASRGLGFLNLVADGDGVFRRTPLLIRYKGRIYPSLGLRVACDTLKVAPRDVVVTPARSIRLRGAREIIIPLDAAGHYRIDFLGPWEAFPHVNYRSVWRASHDPLEMDGVKNAVAGRIAVIADVSTGAGDGGPVPTDPRFPLPGVHATVIHNILSGTFTREARLPEMIAVEMLLLVLVVVAGTRLGARTIGIAALALGVTYFASAAGAFLLQRVILSVVQPLLAMGLSAFAIVAYRFVAEEKARAALRQSFEAYFPPAVVDRVVKNPALLGLSGQKKELTILFSDIVGFTSRSAGMTPDETRQFLNDHFSAMVDIAFDHGGTVDKFIGDGLMVFFGDPEDQPDHAVRAVRSAIAMQRKAAEIGARLARGYAVRIGINTDVVTVGNMGAPRRLSYTVIGAGVNLAQRLETHAPPGGILISARTRELVDGAIPSVSRGAIPIKGLADTVSVYEVPVDVDAAVIDAAI